MAALPLRRGQLGLDRSRHSAGPGDLAHGLQRPAVDGRRQRHLGVAPVALQLLGHGLLHFGSLLVGHETAIDHQVGQLLGRLRGPRRARLGQTIRVNRAVLKGDDAEKQVALGIHDSLTIGSDHRFDEHIPRGPSRTIPSLDLESPSPARSWRRSDCSGISLRVDQSVGSRPLYKLRSLTDFPRAEKPQPHRSPTEEWKGQGGRHDAASRRDETQRGGVSFGRARILGRIPRDGGTLPQGDGPASVPARGGSP